MKKGIILGNDFLVKNNSKLDDCKAENRDLFLVRI